MKRPCIGVGNVRFVLCVCLQHIFLPRMNRRGVFRTHDSKVPLEAGQVMADLVRMKLGHCHLLLHLSFPLMSVTVGVFDKPTTGTADGVPFPLELAFHGTPETNIDSIFKEGLRSKKHWFGCQARVSYSYSVQYQDWDGYSDEEQNNSHWKVLLFVLLMVDPGVQSKNGGVVVMTSKAHELPLVELTLTHG